MPSERPGHIARAPELRRRRGKQRLGQLDEAANELQWTSPEGQLRPARGPEQIRCERKGRPGYIREEQRRPTGRDDAAVDLGGLEVRIDRRLHNREVAVTPQPVDERTQIGETVPAH